MKVVLETNPPKINKKRKILYIIVILICLLSIFAVVTVLVVEKNKPKTPIQYMQLSEEEHLKKKKSSKNYSLIVQLIKQIKAF